jgi:hypothetical protein
MRMLIGSVALAAALLGGGLAVSGPAGAESCAGPSGYFGGHGGGRCDHPPGPDGSFTRCDTVYVFGIGGTNCYQVPAGTPSVVG